MKKEYEKVREELIREVKRKTVIPRFNHFNLEKFNIEALCIYLLNPFMTYLFLIINELNPSRTYTALYSCYCNSISKFYFKILFLTNKNNVNLLLH